MLIFISPYSQFPIATALSPRLGSITQASTVFLGNGPEGEVYVPLKDLLPMVDPDDIVIDGEY